MRLNICFLLLNNQKPPQNPHNLALSVARLRILAEHIGFLSHTPQKKGLKILKFYIAFIKSL